jgi:hypothetical protein|eukprot:Stramenopile-MAST_4_protein_3347
MLSADSPFNDAHLLADERFKDRSTPRTDGGTTARWDVKDYVVVKASAASSSSQSPFGQSVDDKNPFDRFALANAKKSAVWDSRDYQTKKAGSASKKTDKSPFATGQKDIRFQEEKGAAEWDAANYIMIKAQAQASGQKNDSPFTAQGSDDRFEFDKSRRKEQWTVEPYRNFMKVSPQDSKKSDEKSPFKSMNDDSPRTASKKQFERAAQVGNFNIEEA